MADNINKRKEEIRKEIIGRLQSQDSSLRTERSQIIQQKLLLCEEFKACRTVMTYVSLPAEVDTKFFNRGAMELGKRVAVPYLESENSIIASELIDIGCLEKGPLGIYQPRENAVRKIALKEIDLIVVPGIAFDKKNMRLGRGKGFYDRFLADTKKYSIYAIGVAFSFQMVETLPLDFHDSPVDRIITD